MLEREEGDSIEKAEEDFLEGVEDTHEGEIGVEAEDIHEGLAEDIQEEEVMEEEREDTLEVVGEVVADSREEEIEAEEERKGIQIAREVIHLEIRFTAGLEDDNSFRRLAEIWAKPHFI